MKDFLLEGERYPLPRPAEPAPTPRTFGLVPLACLGGLSPAQLALYKLAFEHARQAATPSLPERDLVGVWN